MPPERCQERIEKCVSSWHGQKRVVGSTQRSVSEDMHTEGRVVHRRELVGVQGRVWVDMSCA